MGILSVDLFITLDGVYQGPGGPDEDLEGGFGLGGWQGAYTDDETGAAIVAGIDHMDGLLLGRKTYDIFAASGPPGARTIPSPRPSTPCPSSSYRALFQPRMAGHHGTVGGGGSGLAEGAIQRHPRHSAAATSLAALLDATSLTG